MQNVQIKETGIVCDNPTCDWKDKTVKHADLKDWLNVPCPKCGESVLTQEDYNNSQDMYRVLELLNSMSEDENNQFSDAINREAAIRSDFFKDAKGLDILKESDPEQMLHLKISTHKGIKVTDIEKL